MAKDIGVNLTRPTLISWLEKYKLGNKIAGRWYVEQEQFIQFIKGNDDAEKSPDSSQDKKQ